jgi:hypothetical protein
MATLAAAGLTLWTSVASAAGALSQVEHLRASSFSRSGQFEAAIARTGADELTVVWTSRRQSGGQQGIYLQRLDGNGVAIGPETQVHRFVAAAHGAPCITGRLTPSATAGSFDGSVIAWQSFGQDGDRGSIIARVFGTDGAGGPERLVNEITEGEQSSPVVTTAPNGSVWFAWIDREHAIGVRELRPDGQFEPQRTIATNGFVRTPSIASLTAGNLIVTWTEDLASGENEIRRALVSTSDPTAAIEPETILYDAYEASVAAGPAGAILTWASVGQVGAERVSGGVGHGVWTALLDSHGCIANGPNAGPRFLGEGLAASPLATERGFAVAWTAVAADDPSGRRIALVELDADGRALDGGSNRVTDGLPGNQALRAAAGTTRIASLPAGGVAIAWDGDAGLEDDAAAHVTLVTDRPLARPEGVRAGIDPKHLMVASAEADGSDETAAPYIPPTFDPRGVEHGVRQYAVNDLGLGFDAILDTGWTPPDCNMAVGVTNIIVTTNGRISMFTKDGTQIFTDELEGAGGFWGSLGATGFVFDPECIYDTIHHRYWAMASEGNVGSKSYILLAVSDDDDAAGTWFKYRLETTSLAGAIFDSPNISVDEEAVYVTGDGSLGNYQIFIWDKASMLVGAPPAIAKSLNYVTVPESCGIPAVMDPAAPGLYMLEHKEAASNTKVKFIALTNPLTTPTLTSTEVTVPTYGPPEDAPQKGTTVKIENFEARFWSVDYKAGSFWAAHHINASRVITRWYEFEMNGWPASGNLPTLAQSGNVDLGGTIRTFLCAIGADDQGSAALTFARSGPDEYISMGATFRTPTDPPGTMRTPTTIKTNTGPYTEANRWGDYSAARRDPASPPSSPVFWVNHEYAVGPSSWRSWVQAITLPGPSPDLNGDGAVNAADLAILLGAWGSTGPGDLNGDGTVGAEDLSILLGAWS